MNEATLATSQRMITLAESLTRAERERDSEQTRFVLLHALLQSTKHKLATAERERDEARAANDGITATADKLAERVAELDIIANTEVTETGALALLASAQKRIEGLEAALVSIEAHKHHLCVLCEERLGRALSSPAVTEEGKKLGEEEGEHRPECASLEYVAETNDVTALDCNCGFAAGMPWLDSDRVLAHELLEALDDEPNHEVEVVMGYLARARAAPPKTPEGA